MNINQLREEIAIDEGVKLESYHDHLGLKTVGIGHLCREDEPEFDLPLGTKISEDRCNELFDKDIKMTIKDCKKLYKDFLNLPEEAQRIIANMMFNLGYPRLSKFKKMKEAVDNRDWFEASVQMTDSRWYNQVPNRAKRLVERMKNIS